MYKDLILESLLFSIIMIIFSFIGSYLSDFVLKKNIDWIPEHSASMINGIFLTSNLVYLIFSKYYLSIKCNQK